MKPDFDAMTIAELRAYVLSHRTDDEAFYTLADRLSENTDDTPAYPMPDTPETLALMETILDAHIAKLK